MEISENDLQALNKRLEKLASLKHNLLIGMVRGMGSVIGASLLTAIVVAVLSWIVQSLGGIPFLEGVLESVRQ